MVASLARGVRETSIVIIGDRILCLIGLAAGVDCIEYYGVNCSDVKDSFEKNIDKYGVTVVSRDVYSECRELREVLERISNDILVVVIDTKKAVEEIDVRKYYEDKIRKYIGLKVTL